MEKTSIVTSLTMRPDASRGPQYILDPQYALFANYIRAAKTYVCPTDRDMVNLGGQLFPKLRSYSLNAYVGWANRAQGYWDSRLTPVDFAGQPLSKVFLKHSEMVAHMPNGVFLFQDVNPDSICWPYFGMRMDADIFFNFQLPII
jgi:hypothetical protein